MRCRCPSQYRNEAFSEALCGLRINARWRFLCAVRHCRSRTVDVGTGTIVIALQEDHARPDIDRLFVFRCEVMIETGDEKGFDARRALGVV